VVFYRFCDGYLLQLAFSYLEEYKISVMTIIPTGSRNLLESDFLVHSDGQMAESALESTMCGQSPIDFGAFHLSGQRIQWIE